MFQKRFSRALAFTVISTLVMASAAFADQVVVDGDTATAGSGNSAFTLCEGVGGSVTVKVTLNYAGATHFSNGTVSVAASLVDGNGSTFITASSGSLTLSSWDSNSDTTFTDDLTISVASDWLAKSATDGGPYKVRYSLTQIGTTYTEAKDNVVNITEQTTGCDTNAAPVLDAIGDKTIAEGSTLAFALSATDVDGDELIYSMSGDRNDGVDDNMSLSPAGAFSWTPGDNYLDYSVTFSVSDGTDSDSETVTISSTNVNPSASANATPFATSLVAGGMNLTAKFDYSDVGWHDEHTNSFFTWTIDGGTPITAGATLSGTGDTLTTPPLEVGTASNTQFLAAGCYEVSVTGTAKDDDLGQSSALSIASAQQVDVPVIEFLAPIQDNERNIAKYGNVVPVKVRMTSSCTGLAITNVDLFITWVKGSGGEIIEGSETIATSVSSADSGSQMRLADGFYIYNFSTKVFPTAGIDYSVRIRLGSSTGPILLTAVLQPKK